MDCPCCGDRWHEPWNEEGDKEPSYYSTPLRLAKQGLDKDGNPERWSSNWWGLPIYVHYLDGTVEKVVYSKAEAAEN